MASLGRPVLMTQWCPAWRSRRTAVTAEGGNGSVQVHNGAVDVKENNAHIRSSQHVFLDYKAISPKRESA